VCALAVAAWAFGTDGRRVRHRVLRSLIVVHKRDVSRTPMGGARLGFSSRSTSVGGVLAPRAGLIGGTAAYALWLVPIRADLPCPRPRPSATVAWPSRGFTFRGGHPGSNRHGLLLLGSRSAESVVGDRHWPRRGGAGSPDVRGRVLGLAARVGIVVDVLRGGRRACLEVLQDAVPGSSSGWAIGAFFLWPFVVMLLGLGHTRRAGLRRSHDFAGPRFDVARSVEGGEPRALLGRRPRQIVTVSRVGERALPAASCGYGRRLRFPAFAGRSPLLLLEQIPSVPAFRHWPNCSRSFCAGLSWPVCCFVKPRRGRAPSSAPGGGDGGTIGGPGA
jgi:hypothetical protein